MLRSMGTPLSIIIFKFKSVYGYLLNKKELFLPRDQAEKHGDSTFISSFQFKLVCSHLLNKKELSLPRDQAEKHGDSTFISFFS